MRSRYFVDLKKLKRLKNLGKIDNLVWLYKKGLRVPQTWLIHWEKCEEYMTEKSDFSVFEQDLEVILPDGIFAVRSSAAVEDRYEGTFAGQFLTVLNVTKNDLANAVKKVWMSSKKPEVISYADRVGLDLNSLKMSVIIQQMVSASFSGVSFSRNPMTGMNEIVIEAVEGTGDKLVQEGVTPYRWTRKWGNWLEFPKDAPVPPNIIEEIADKTRLISKSYGRPVDLEWAFDGEKLFWLQLRDITAFNDVNLYSNAISREFLPGQIKPLVWSINIPLVNGAWIRLFRELVGKKDLDVNNLAKAFYYRAYFNMGVVGGIFEAMGMPKETLELLLGLDIDGPEKPRFKPTMKMFFHLPRLVVFVAKNLFLSKKVESLLSKGESDLKSLNYLRVRELNTDSIFVELEELHTINQKIAYFNIVVPLVMYVYNRALKKKLEKRGYDFEDMDVNSLHSGVGEFDPNKGLQKLHSHYMKLSEEEKSRLSKLSYKELVESEDYISFAEDLEQFLQKFGHFSDSGNDFSSVPWRERPELVMKIISNYRKPHDKCEDATFKTMKDASFENSLKRTARFVDYRDRISSLYTFGYGLFRVYFLELGERLARAKLLNTFEDIFFLSFDEIKNIFSDGNLKNIATALIKKRKQEMADCLDMVLPDIIFGEEEPPIIRSNGPIIKGTPTSRGYYKGIARVIRGIEEFDNLNPGEVLIIPFSDVGWTPLFAKAGAIVAEAGGILSHSSIVAREYGIPAVVSVNGACSIKSGTLISVDGYAGEVVIHEE